MDNNQSSELIANQLDFETITTVDVQSAEQDLLSFLVFDEEQVADNVSVNNLHADWFITKAAKDLFQAISDLKFKGQVIDKTSIKNYLLGLYPKSQANKANPALEYLIKLEHKFDLFKIDHKIRILQIFHIKNELNKLCLSIVNTQPSLQNFVNLTEAWQQKLLDIIAKQEFKDYLLAKEVVDQYNELIEQARGFHDNEERFLRTNYSFLDNKIKGLIGGQLLILAARPGMGKTTFALNILSRNLSKITTQEPSDKLQSAIGIFSLEMTKESLLEKLIAIHGTIDLNEVKKPLEGRIIEKSYHLKAIEAQKKIIANSNLLFCDRSNISIGEMQGMIKTWARKYNLKLVVIDYLQLINVDDGRENIGLNQQQKIAKISRTLKLNSNDLNIPILALAQLNRKSEERRGNDREPLLSDLRESGSIEQDADIVMFLSDGSLSPTNDQANAQDHEKKKIVDVILKIGKNRHGDIGKVTFKFNRPNGTFELSGARKDDNF